jgi:type IV secretory pathway VirB6-like protein
MMHEPVIKSFDRINRVVFEFRIQGKGAMVIVQVELVGFSALGAYSLVCAVDHIAADWSTHWICVQRDIGIEDRADLAIVPTPVQDLLMAIYPS